MISISEFLLVVDSVYSFAFVSHLHQKVRVVVRFLRVEMDILGSIDLEIVVYFLSGLLLDQTLAMDTHLLSIIEDTETGSLILFAT